MYKRIAIVVTIAVVIKLPMLYIYKLTLPHELPALDTNRWWGPGLSGVADTIIRNFKIEYSDTIINDLRERLKNRRNFTKPLENIQSQYGINTNYLDDVLNHWRNEYDFKQRIKRLNKFSHYKTNIQGLDIHFIKATPNITESEGFRVMPLLMLHGWPSSSKEFDKVIPILTKTQEDSDFVFEVVAPDLPGFGFSQGTTKPGLNPVQIAIMMRNLMRRLGYNTYMVHGGDWGAQVGTHLATIFHKEVYGFHTTMGISSKPMSMLKYAVGIFFPRLVVEKKYESRMYPVRDLIRYFVMESGYFHIQTTKPDTIGAALTDSPASLAGYIIEKMAICSNRDALNTTHGGLEDLDINDVLDTLTILWVNNCITTATRIYAEGGAHRTPEVNLVHQVYTKVPVAVMNMKYEVVYQTPWLLKDKYPLLQQFTTYDHGGHFAAMQDPGDVAEDIFDAVHAFNKYYANRDN